MEKLEAFVVNTKKFVLTIPNTLAITPEEILIAIQEYFKFYYDAPHFTSKEKILLCLMTGLQSLEEYKNKQGKKDLTK